MRMDRLLEALANSERRRIVECVLGSDTAMTAATIRSTMKVPQDRRAHFGRQLSKLYDIGVLERDEHERLAVADAEVIERFLMAAATAEAALDERRANRSAAAARERHRRDTRRRTDRAAGRGDAGEAGA